MTMEILCTPYFTDTERDEINRCAEKVHMSAEKFVREAVKFFAAQCVPTQYFDSGKRKLVF